jgi:anti-sigma regulatory factor (Ser/Thr protein kinase)
MEVTNLDSMKEFMQNLILPITERSQVAEARRLVATFARRIGFDETETGRVALVVTEVTGNLVKHTTQGGELLLREIESGNVAGLEILALDKGPGLKKISAVLRNGYSSAGTPGTGLGAIRRLSSTFDLHSISEKGTAVLARIWQHALPKKALPHGLEIGALNVPMSGEESSGDAWAVHQEENRCLILVADGLGHGVDAAEASSEAVRVFKNNKKLSPAGMIEAIHMALRHTRGAAVAVAEVDNIHEVVRFAGVGNIAGVILFPEKNRNMVSHNGTLGYEARKIQEFSYPWSREAMMILNTDGLKTHWSLKDYPGLEMRHPSLIAGVLYRDFSRRRDDVTLVVAKNTGDKNENPET